MLQKALHLIQSACTVKGISASPIEQDNYTRIWARDSMIAGIAGLLSEDEIVIEGFKSSLETLRNGQNKLGVIPSNVKTDLIKSYGGIAGRVDATLWYIIGTGLYILNHTEEVNANEWKKSLDQSLKALEY